MTRDADFARGFFDQYVRGREAPDFRLLLESVGIELKAARPGTAWIGPLNMRFGDGVVTMLGTPLLDTPLSDVGIDRGDRITSIDGVTLTGRSDLVGVLARHRPGDAVTVRFESRGETYEATLTLMEDPALAAALAQGGGTGQQIAARAAWSEASKG